MHFVSVTRLRVLSVRFLPGFVRYAFASISQVKVADGFIEGALLADRRLTFWTMTVWSSEESMRSFMTSGAHKEAMVHLMEWCDEASVVHWTEEPADGPSWREADWRMRAEGHASKVNHPSAQHATLEYRDPRLTVGGPIKRVHK